MRLTAIFQNWRLILIATVIASAAALWMRLEMVTAQRDLAVSNLAEYKRLADAAMKKEKKQNEDANDAIRTAYPLMVEQVKKDAYANYLAKVGPRSAACGATDRLRLRPGSGDVQTLRPEGVDAASRESLAARPDIPASAAGTDDVAARSEREFVAGCANDAGRLALWIRWAVLNQLPVE